jgi:hypothetical protein
LSRDPLHNVRVRGRTDPVHVRLVHRADRLARVTEEGYYLPERFSARILGFEVPFIDIEAAVQDGRVSLSQFTLSAYSNDDVRLIPVHLTVGPLPLRELVFAVAALFGMRRVGSFDPRTDTVAEPLAAEDRPAFVRALAADGRKRKRRSRDQIDEMVHDVARVYRAAEAAGKPVGEAVRLAQPWGPVSAATAWRWIKRARDLGLLVPDSERGGFA